jgi:hypothetical protein
LSIVISEAVCGGSSADEIAGSDRVVRIDRVMHMHIERESRHCIPTWNGEVDPERPNGWLEGSGLTVEDYFFKGDRSLELSIWAPMVLEIARRCEWSVSDAHHELRLKLAYSENDPLRLHNRIPPKFSEALFSIMIEDWWMALEPPGIVLTAELLQVYGKTEEGVLIEALRPPWLRLVALLHQDASFIYQIDSRKMEELIAGAYEQDGFEVILTPRSGDHGRDVIATCSGGGGAQPSE